MITLADLSVERLFRIEDDVAVVTGAGAGFGQIAAMTLASAGALVAVTDIDGAAAVRVVEEITSGGGRAEPFTLDVADRRAVKSTIAKISERFGGIQILVNNAGIARRGPTEDLPDEDWDAVVEVNMTAPFICSREVGRYMLSAGKGCIINISSIMGLVGNDLFPNLPYMATKGALVNMTRALAVEWAGRGVRINAIAPSFFNTTFGRSMWQDPERARMVHDRTPMGRFGEPEELAGGILYLASQASSMVTGHTLVIDGGWLAK
jgi:NAD(P)-dependent dehydrogenase (short-subunit alcohol dehydrogenase family)